MQDFFKNLFEYSPDAVLVINRNSEIILANKQTEIIFGYAYSEIIGKQIDIIIPERFREKHFKHISNYFKNPVVREMGSEMELLALKKNKTEFYVEIMISPLGENEELMGMAIIRDITERKAGKKKLEIITENLKDAQEIAHVGNWELNFANNMSVWSDEACRIYGFPTNTNNIYSFDMWMSFIHPDDLNFVLRQLERTYETFGTSSYKHRIVHKDGTIRHIYSRSLHKFNSEGFPVGIVGTCHDITEQEMIALALVENENRIRNFANHLTKTIESERAYIARELHDEVGSQLLGVKHSLLSFGKLSNNEEERKKSSLNSMISDIENAMKSLQKISIGLRPSIIDTLGLVQSIIWLVEEFEKKTNIRCQLVSDDHEAETYNPNISICYFRICQEALTNIKKHAEATKVFVKISRTENKLILIITDNGNGMLNTKLENPFSMGLLGMRERAKIIGADLQIISEKKSGTIIRLELILN